jgi:UDP-N-acetylglucosamine--N-acetylmuramyl-(pentapeptide) pyrophosphoryl-undecaprenol N-acetylglucosamine transferase
LADLQVLHLTGPADYEKVRKSYVERQIPASVHAFLERMDLALGTATLAISRSGASSMAELAAAQLPALLIPYPVATDNHQWHNARAFVETGAALMMEQSNATDEAVVAAMIGLLQDAPGRERMQAALRGWQQPQAAGQIAESILRSISRSAAATAASVPNATTGRSSQRNDPTNAAPGRSSQRNDPTTLCEVAAK